jgi:hypothetical protein
MKWLENNWACKFLPDGELRALCEQYFGTVLSNEE